MSAEAEERHMGATVSLNEFTIDQPDTGMRPDSGHSQSSIRVFSTQASKVA